MSTGAMPESRLQQFLGDFAQVLQGLEEALAAGPARFADDSAVLHFELCLEVAWKSARAYALTQGLQPAGPRDSLSALITLGVHADEQVLAQMLRARNDAVHIYRKALAAALRKQLPGFAKELAGIYRELSARAHGAS